MKKAKFIAKACILATGFSVAFTALANYQTTSTANVHTSTMNMNHPEMSTTSTHPMYHKCMNSKKCMKHMKWWWSHHQMGTFVKYGPLYQGKNWVSIPVGVNPGTRGECWSRGLETGKIKLGLPGYGDVWLTPNNPLGVFAVPTGGKFLVDTKPHTTNFISGFFGTILPFGNKQSNSGEMPVRLMCHFY